MVGTKGQGTPGARAARADGRAMRVSSRVQDTIEGKAQDVTPPNPPPEEQVDPNVDTTSFEAADAPLEHEVPHAPPPEGPVLDQPMPAEPVSGTMPAEPVSGTMPAEPVSGTMAAESAGAGSPAGAGTPAKPMGAGKPADVQKPLEPETAFPQVVAAMGGPVELAAPVDLAGPATTGAATAGPESIAVPPTDPEGVTSLPRKDASPRKRGMGLLLLGALLILGAAGAAAWSTMGQGGGDLLSSVRRMVGYESAPKATSPASTANSPTRPSASSPTSSSIGPSAGPSGLAQNPPAAQAPRPPSSPVVTAPAPPIGSSQTASSSQASAPQASPALQNTPAPQASVPPPGPAKPPVSTPATAPVEARKPDTFAEPRKAELPAAAVPTPSATPPSVSDPRVAELDRRLIELDAKLGAMASSPAKPAPETVAALAAQTTRVGKIDDTVAAQTTRVGKIDDTLAGLDKRLASLEQQLATPKTDARAAQAPDVRTRDIDAGAARVVVAQGLLAAVQSGASFAQPLAALRALGVEEPTLARLSASAGSGVPTIAALRENFAAARTKLRPATKPTAGAGFGDTMMARLGSLVSIKPATERAGPSPEAVATRIDAALGRDDLAGALAEVRALPPGDAALVKDWTDSAAKRAEAETDARALIAAGVAALAKPKS